MDPFQIINSPIWLNHLGMGMVLLELMNQVREIVMTMHCGLRQARAEQSVKDPNTVSSHLLMTLPHASTLCMWKVEFWSK